MKKDTIASLIIFCVVFVLAYIMAGFIPNEILAYNNNTSALSFLGDMAVTVITMRGMLALAIALAVTLLVRIVDTDESGKKQPKKQVQDKEAK